MQNIFPSFYNLVIHLENCSGKYVKDLLAQIMCCPLKNLQKRTPKIIFLGGGKFTMFNNQPTNNPQSCKNMIKGCEMGVPISLGQPKKRKAS